MLRAAIESSRLLVDSGERPRDPRRSCMHRKMTWLHALGWLMLMPHALNEAAIDPALVRKRSLLGIAQVLHKRSLRDIRPDNPQPGKDLPPVHDWTGSVWSRCGGSVIRTFGRRRSAPSRYGAMVQVAASP